MDTAPRTDAAGRILLEFQSVMEQFLETERHVLGVYLSGPVEAGRDIAPHSDLFALTTGVPATAPEPGDLPTAREPVSTSARTPVTQPDSPAIEEPVKAVRLTPRPASRPAPSSRAPLAAGGAILLTDDGGGVCGRLAGRLRTAGHRVAIISLADTADPERHVYHSQLDSEGEVDRVVQLVSSACGPIAALVHLLPLSPGPGFDDLDVAGWSRRLSAETRSLFLLTKALRPSLEAAATNGGAFVVAATAMGGAFGCDPLRPAGSIFPGHGGVTGFIKCLSLEWPKVRAKTIDLDATEPLAVLTEQIFEELWIDDQEVEIGYAGGSRLALEITRVPARIAEGFAIPSDAVILATGGARGITAEVCLELAERYQPTFVLVGQSPLPEPMEPEDTAT